MTKTRTTQIIPINEINKLIKILVDMMIDSTQKKNEKSLRSPFMK